MRNCVPYLPYRYDYSYRVYIRYVTPWSRGPTVRPPAGIILGPDAIGTKDSLVSTYIGTKDLDSSGCVQYSYRSLVLVRLQGIHTVRYPLVPWSHSAPPCWDKPWSRHDRDQGFLGLDVHWDQGFRFLWVRMTTGYTYGTLPPCPTVRPPAGIILGPDTIGTKDSLVSTYIGTKD